MPIAFEKGVMFDTDMQRWGRPLSTFIVWVQQWNQTSFSGPSLPAPPVPSEWQKAQKYKFACQEMALNIVLGGQEDGFLMNATGVCCILPTTLQGDGAALAEVPSGRGLPV